MCSALAESSLGFNSFCFFRLFFNQENNGAENPKTPKITAIRKILGRTVTTVPVFNTPKISKVDKGKDIASMLIA